MSRFVSALSLFTLFLLGVAVGLQGGRYIERKAWEAEVQTLVEVIEERIMVLEEEIERLSSKYEIMYAVIQCESSGSHEGVWGDLDYRYPAYGITQVQRRTFYWLAGKANFQGAEWKNREHQLKLLSWSIENGYGPLWTCYRKHVASKEGGLS